MAGGAELVARAPWDRPGESRGIRRLRIAMVVIVGVGVLGGVAAIVVVVVFSLRAVLLQ